MKTQYNENLLWDMLAHDEIKDFGPVVALNRSKGKKREAVERLILQNRIKVNRKNVLPKGSV